MTQFRYFLLFYKQLYKLKNYPINFQPIIYKRYIDGNSFFIFFFLHSSFTEIESHISILVDSSKLCIYNIWHASEIEENNSILVFDFEITFECNNFLHLFMVSLYLRSLYLKISKIYAFVI